MEVVYKQGWCKVVSNKNLTITLNGTEHDDLNNLVDYFQQQSISTVTKSDVIKFMIKQMKLAVEKNKVNDMRNMLENDGEA
jgi:acylphosphatase